MLFAVCVRIFLSNNKCRCAYVYDNCMMDMCVERVKQVLVYRSQAALNSIARGGWVGIFSSAIPKYSKIHLPPFEGSIIVHWDVLR